MSSPTIEGYVVLMRDDGVEASDRVPVKVELSPGRETINLNILGLPISLPPTQFGLVRAVFVFADDAWVDIDGRQHAIRAGDSYTITAQA